MAATFWVRGVQGAAVLVHVMNPTAEDEQVESYLEYVAHNAGKIGVLYRHRSHALPLHHSPQKNSAWRNNGVI